MSDEKEDVFLETLVRVKLKQPFPLSFNFMIRYDDDER